ncbi:MAG: DUF2309 domain-containing protein [Magnetococcales bacterium]|nr:DUF2309 domain-containing protein [Magnetococcales bacterium]
MHETPSSGRMARIRETLHHLEHLLPGQAAITDFIHHNTLHGFQHLPFPRALAEARRWTGIYGYLPPERFRALYAQGRITRADLEWVIRQDPELRAAEPLGPTHRLEVICLQLLHGIAPISPRQLSWQIEEQGALERFQSGVSPEAVQAVLQGKTQTAVLEDLWRACLDGFGLSHGHWFCEERLDHASNEAFLDEDQVSLSQQAIIAAIRAAAGRSWSELSGQVGVTLTLSGLLRAVTGMDLSEAIRPYLVRLLGAFLDLGVASWTLPEREAGLYQTWKKGATTELAQALDEMPDWSEWLADLPETAEEALADGLLRLGLPEERWAGYLQRLALELPGWAGMVCWRSQRPGYGGSTARVALADYLAVRLILERWQAARLCRSIWLIEPTLDTLGWYFHRYRGEFLVRRALFAGELDDSLTTRATRLLHRSPTDPDLAPEWRKLALALWKQTGTPETVRVSASRQAWPLFLLAQHLGWSAAQLRSWNETNLAAQLLEQVQAMDDAKAGLLWLCAYERHYREEIFAALRANRGRGRWLRRDQGVPSAQVLFCMDDREEGIRRHLEEQDPTIETLGAAGFFGVPVHWQGLDDVTTTALCPVVVVPSHKVQELPLEAGDGVWHRHRFLRRVTSGWKRLLTRESHRGFLVPTLVSFLLAPWVWLELVVRGWWPVLWARWMDKLALWLDPPVVTRMTRSALDPTAVATPVAPRLGFTLDEQAGRVAGLLRTMGLTHGFASVVAILGHGGSSVNNPHLAAYDCGACSGRHGGPNARLFAAMANDPDVRLRLAQQGISIPEHCWFVGGEHNTGNERIAWFDLDLMPSVARVAMERLMRSLEEARLGSAHERARRLASAPHGADRQRALDHMGGRAVDISQARPELGHATNAVAVIGRRAVTQGVFFDRRMFLISYDPTQDPEGLIVESILLAAGPVGAGISLEYYFSSVDNERFGCGTKVAHNLTGLFGVMDGTASDLRTGLPRQMVEIHEPMRLLVIVEQRPEILTIIYQRQEALQELVGNGWVVLAALDPESGVVHEFSPRSGWSVWSEGDRSPLPEVARSADWYRGHSGPLAPALIAI